MSRSMAKKRMSGPDAFRMKNLRKSIEEYYRTSHQQGLLVGSRAILKAIANIISRDKVRSSDAILAEVMTFVNNLLAMTDKTALNFVAQMNPMDVLAVSSAGNADIGDVEEIESDEKQEVAVEEEQAVAVEKEPEVEAEPEPEAQEQAVNKAKAQDDEDDDE